MNMNLSPRRVWINSNAQHAHQFDCTFTGENMESHSRMPKPDLSTCGSFSQPFHEFFTAFSRVFHGLFTFLGVALFVYFCDSFSGNHEDMILRPPTTISDQANIAQARLQRPSFKSVAHWQVEGNISFYSYLIRGNVKGDQYENHCTSFCYTIMMLMGGLGYS